MTTEDILGYDIYAGTAAELLTQVQCWLDGGARGRVLACANPHSLEVARTDDLFRAALQQADVRVPDGAGVVLASRILGGAIRGRITGSDVFLGVSGILDIEGVRCQVSGDRWEENREEEAEEEKGQGGRRYRYFFLGSTAENLAEIRRRMAADYPGIEVAGTYAPPFKAEFDAADDAAMTAAVNAARPDVLWVGLTAPKQEKWIQRNRDRLDVAFIAAVGAVFDFYTGRVRRSSSLFRRLGLEWLPRLVREPRRLWRRNFVSNPRFMARVLRARVKR